MNWKKCFRSGTGAIGDARFPTNFPDACSPPTNIWLSQAAELWSTKTVGQTIQAVTGGASLRYNDLAVSGSKLAGMLQPIDASAVDSSGYIGLSTTRFFFMGDQRSIEINLRDLLGVRGAGGFLDLQWSGKQRGERFKIANADIVADITRAVALRRIGELGSTAVAPGQIVPTPPHEALPS
jgi:hypothetical protein